MDKNELLESAKKLKIVSDKTSSEYKDKEEQLINKMNVVMLDRPDILTLIGDVNIEMMKDNHANHVLFIASILKNYNPNVLVDTILWVFRAYRSHGFKTNYWSAQLNSWLSILKESLTPESYQEVFVYYEWMIINIPTFTILSDESLGSPNSLH